MTGPGEKGRHRLSRRRPGPFPVVGSGRRSQTRLQSLSRAYEHRRRFARPGRRRLLVSGGPAVFCGMNRLIYAAEVATAVAIIARIVVL